MNEREYGQMYQVEDSHWWYRALHDSIVSAVAREHQQKGSLSILDAGCGTGRLCQLLQRFGQVHGCDFSPTAIDFCRARNLPHVFQADLNSIDLGECRYDVITAIDVLYHRAIIDEAAVLARLYRSLKPGGLLIVNLVAFEFLRSTHDIAVHTRERYTRGRFLPRLRREGFAVERASYRLALLFFPIISYRLLKRCLPRPQEADKVASDVAMPSPVANRLLYWLARLDNRLVDRFPLPFGTSLFVLARRPPA